MERLHNNAKKSRRWLFILLLALCLASVAGYPPAAAGQAAGEELYLTILHTNDEHSAVIPHSPAIDFHPLLDNPTVGGFARLATAVKEIREQKAAAGEPVLLLSGGDFMGESPFSWLAPRGHAPELTLMQHLGYDAVTVGNHEYDYGAANLALYLQAAGYPDAHRQTAVLAANTQAPAGHPLAAGDILRDVHVVELENGLTVGLFGLIGREAVTFAGENSAPLVFADPVETARAAVQKLQARGADLVVALTHAGVEEDRVLAREVPGIHVIVGGHCHTALEEPVIEGKTLIVQAGTQLRYLGQLELAYDPATGEVRTRNATTGAGFLLPLDHRVALDAETAALIGGFTAELNTLIAAKTGGRFNHIMDTVVTADFAMPHTPPLQETPFGNFLTDAMRLVTWQKTGKRVDFAIQANGQIRGGLVPGSLDHARGRISFFDLAQQVGLGIGPDGYAGYPVVAFYVTGEEMRRALEVAVLLAELMGDTYYLQFSGLRYDFNQENAILFNLPFIDQPLPSTRAVVKAERYIGEGRQGTDDGQYVPLERGDQTLYRVVSDRYIVTFLPMVGEMLPMLEIVLKDENGNPVPLERLDDLIVRVDGEELKVWQTAVEYAASQPPGEGGLPALDPYYAATAGRINPVEATSLLVWLGALAALLVVLLAAAVILLVRHRRRRKARMALSQNKYT